MDCFVNMKKMMKRKDPDDLDEDFSDFSLSSPARKIRRLDMELPTMMEDEDTEIVIPSDEPSPGARPARTGPVIEELPTSSASALPVPANEERAIVLFTPVNGSSLLQTSPSTVSLSIDPNLIAGFRRHYRGSNLHTVERAGDDDVEAAEELKECKAMVPWVPPSQLPNVCGSQTAEAPPNGMEDDEMGEAFMEIEEEEEDIGSVSSKSSNFSSIYGEAAANNSMPPPQWSHCMTPQVPPAPSSPIVWFR